MSDINNSNSPDWQKTFRDEWMKTYGDETCQDWQSPYQQTTINIPIPYNNACPACGYCPHCGRGGYQAHPWWGVIPYYPRPVYWYDASEATVIGSL